MAEYDIVLKFIQKSKDIRYWYLTRRKGRYTISVSSFKQISELYGKFYNLALSKPDVVLDNLRLIIENNISSSMTATAQDYKVLLETSLYFNINIPASLSEELNALIKDVVEVSKSADINEYLKANAIYITQYFWDLCTANNIKIDEAFIQGSTPPTKEAPLVVIQGAFHYGTTNEEIAHPLFGLPNVVPLIPWFMDVHEGYTPEKVANDVSVIVINLRDRFKGARPDKPFKWAFWPQNYAAWNAPRGGPVDNRLFFHVKDKMADGTNFVFTKNGREEWKKWSTAFFAQLSSVLAKNNVPPPEYMDADYEGGVGISPPDWALKEQWHDIVMKDPRATTEKIDGVRTYAEFTSSFTDLDGKPIAGKDLYPYVYDGDPAVCKRVNFYNSLYTMVIDYGLWDTLYEPAKKVWPNVKCGNFAIHGATKEINVHDWRFKETPVYGADNFHADYQVPVNYGWEPKDAIWQPLGNGFNTYNDCLVNYGVKASGDYNTDVRNLHIGQTEYFCKGCELARPDKPIAFWLSYGYAGNIFYQYPSLPKDATATLKFDRELIMNMFKVFNKYNVGIAAFFNPEGGVPLYDRIYEVVGNLGEAGYHYPSK